MSSYSIPWTQALALEIGDLDDDHQQMLLRVNELLKAVDSGDKTGILMAFDGLRTEAQEHFAKEEAQMQEFRYPDAAQHCEAHRQMLYGLSRLQMTLSTAEHFASGAGPFMFLQRWFEEHLTRDDRKLAEFLNRRGPKAESAAT